MTWVLCDSIVFVGGERTEMSELIEEERGAEGREEGRRNTAVCSARCRIRGRAHIEDWQGQPSLLLLCLGSSEPQHAPVKYVDHIVS